MDKKTYGMIMTGTAASLGVRNIKEMSDIKKELKTLSNPKEARILYRDSGSRKPYNTWLNDRKMYLNAQLKTIRYSNAGVAGGMGLGAANIFSDSDKPLRAITALGPDANFTKSKYGNVAGLGAMAGMSAAGSVYSFKKIVEYKKELKQLHNLSDAKKLYKLSGSKEPFNTWKDNRIKELNKAVKGYIASGIASAGVSGIATLSAIGNLRASNESIEILDEAFYGKNEILRKLEDDLWGTLIQAVSNGENPYKYKENIHNAEKELCKLFNFESIKIYIGSNYGYSQAFTIGWQNMSNLAIKDNYDVVETNEGIKFKDSKNKRINVYLYPSLLDGRLTKEELMAVFLHEVGHNFYTTKEYLLSTHIGRFVDALLDSTFKFIINPNETIIEYISEIKILLLQFGFSKMQDLIPTKYHEKILKVIVFLQNPGSYDIIGDKLHINLTAFNKVIGSLREVISNTASLINMIISPLRILIATVFILLIRVLFKDAASLGLHSMSYQAEKYADAFAAKHGYGKELYTSLENMRKISSFDVVAVLSKIRSLFLLYMGEYFVDEHPTHITRCRKILALYKKELAENERNLTSKQKAEIKHQIDEMEKLMTMSSDKSLIKNIELKLDEPYSRVREKIDNTLAKTDGTFNN